MNNPAIPVSDFIGLVFISLGLALDLIGCLGMVRLPDMYNRLQASTKCVTVGTCSILFGAFLVLTFTKTAANCPPAGIKCLLCALFLLLTAPAAAHAISRGAHRSGLKLYEGSVMDNYLEDKEGEA